MRRTTMLWEVFVRRFQEAFEQYEKHRLTGCRLRAFVARLADAA